MKAKGVATTNGKLCWKAESVATTYGYVISRTGAWWKAKSIAAKHSRKLCWKAKSVAART